MLGNMGVWAAAVCVYRMQKDRHGVSNDLWGWTCSSHADSIQADFEGVINFEKFCSVQVCFLLLSDAQFTCANLLRGRVSAGMLDLGKQVRRC